METTRSDEGSDDEFGDPPSSPSSEETAVATAATAALVGELVSAATSPADFGPHDDDCSDGVGEGYQVTVAEERARRSRQLDIVSELLGRVSRRSTPSDRDHVGATATGDGGDFLRTTAPSAGSDVTFRDALDGLPSSSASGLVSSLVGLIGHRAELAELLPGTQDPFGNEEAMGLPSPDGGGGGAKCAMTLTRLALTSGRLYASLLGTRGAWGSGAVDAGAVSSLSSLVRRWGVEVRGREGSAAKQQKARKSAKGGSAGGRPPLRKRCKPGESGGEGGGAAEQKLERDARAAAMRSRKSVRISEFVSVMDDADDEHDGTSDEEDGNDRNEDVNPMDVTFSVTSQPSSSVLTERELVTEGLLLATSLGGAAARPDFRNWSPDARESYLEALAGAHGIVSALHSGGKGLEDDVDAMCRDAVTSLEGAMRSAVLPSRNAEPEVATADRKKRGNRASKSRRSSAAKEDAERQRLRETAVQLLRGLLPLLELRTELPYGQAGKVAAHESASSLLVGIIGSISEEIELNSSRGTRSSTTPVVDFDDGRTPSRRKGRRSSLGGGRRSISFAHTPGNKSRRDSAPPGTGEIVPPSLKKTPRRSGRLSSLSAGGASEASHPVLTVLIGLLHRLLTSRGLERADARSRSSEFALACLAVLPSKERSGLVKFAEDMTESKVSSHRLLGVELIGRVLCEGWFWRDHENSKENKAGGWAATPFVGSAGTENASIRSGENESAIASGTSLSLLGALRGRLSDVNGTVRARSALSLGEVVKRATSAREENVNLDGTVIASSTPLGANAGGKGGEGTLQTRALTEALCAVGPELIVALRRRASTDASANVRKGSIVAWLGFLTLANREGAAGAAIGDDDEEDGGGGFVVGGQDISALCQLCNDPSVATRKVSFRLEFELTVNYPPPFHVSKSNQSIRTGRRGRHDVPRPVQLRQRQLHPAGDVARARLGPHRPPPRRRRRVHVRRQGDRVLLPPGGRADRRARARRGREAGGRRREWERPVPCSLEDTLEARERVRRGRRFEERVGRAGDGAAEAARRRGEGRQGTGEESAASR